MHELLFGRERAAEQCCGSQGEHLNKSNACAQQAMISQEESSVFVRTAANTKGQHMLCTKSCETQRRTIVVTHKAANT